LVLKGPTVDDETMCFEAWEFQALTHKDRTAKSAIFPFQGRKVKKGIPPKSHTLSLIEETKRKDKVTRFLADAIQLSQEVSRAFATRRLKGRSVLRRLALELLVVVVVSHGPPGFQHF
jgi:hypothetical protein